MAASKMRKEPVLVDAEADPDHVLQSYNCAQDTSVLVQKGKDYIIEACTAFYARVTHQGRTCCAVWMEKEEEKHIYMRFPIVQKDVKFLLETDNAVVIKDNFVFHIYVFHRTQGMFTTELDLNSETDDFDSATAFAVSKDDHEHLMLCLWNSRADKPRVASFIFEGDKTEQIKPTFVCPLQKCGTDQPFHIRAILSVNNIVYFIGTTNENSLVSLCTTVSGEPLSNINMMSALKGSASTIKSAHADMYRPDFCTLLMDDVLFTFYVTNAGQKLCFGGVRDVARIIGVKDGRVLHETTSGDLMINDVSDERIERRTLIRSPAPPSTQHVSLVNRTTYHAIVALQPEFYLFDDISHTVALPDVFGFMRSFLKETERVAGMLGKAQEFNSLLKMKVRALREEKQAEEEKALALHKRLEAELKALKLKHEQLTGTHGDVVQRNFKLQEELEKMNNSHLTTLTKLKTELSKTKVLVNEVKSLKEENIRCRAEAEEMERVVAERFQHLVSAKDVEIARLSRENDELRRCLDNRGQALAECRGAKDKLEKRLERAEGRGVELAGQIEKALKELQSLRVATEEAAAATAAARASAEKEEKTYSLDLDQLPPPPMDVLVFPSFELRDNAVQTDPSLPEVQVEEVMALRGQVANLCHRDIQAQNAIAALTFHLNECESMLFLCQNHANLWHTVRVRTSKLMEARQKCDIVAKNGVKQYESDFDAILSTISGALRL